MPSDGERLASLEARMEVAERNTHELWVHANSSIKFQSGWEGSMKTIKFFGGLIAALSALSVVLNAFQMFGK